MTADLISKACFVVLGILLLIGNLYTARHKGRIRAAHRLVDKRVEPWGFRIALVMNIFFLVGLVWWFASRVLHHLKW